jgi:hypothetical protein
MIKWNCNFQIPDSSTQLDVAVIVIESFKNIGNTCVVTFNLMNDLQEYIVKTYTKTFDQRFENEDSIYAVEVNQYQDSIIV